MKKKCIKKKKAPSYAFGIEQIAKGFQPVGNIFDAAGNVMTTAAPDTSKAAVAGETFKSLGKGASMGAQLGSIVPGIGTVIGGAIGAVGGALKGVFTGRKRRLEALDRQRKTAQTNETNLALANQAAIEQDYWNDNNLAYTFENGGILPNFAWVDNNEVIRDNAGNLIKVPNTKPGTDNHLINSTYLDSVLSDKLKRPGTNKTFAQEGEKLTKMTKGSKGKDRFAKASDELNKLHANQMYNTLLSEQAAVKAKKGIKPKVKGVAPAYETGTPTTVGGKAFARFLDWWDRNSPSDYLDRELMTKEEFDNSDERSKALYRVSHGGLANPNRPFRKIDYDYSKYGANAFDVVTKIMNQANDLVNSSREYSLIQESAPKNKIGETNISGSDLIDNSNNSKKIGVIGNNVATTNGKNKRVSSTPVVTKQKTPLALTKPINTPTLPTVNKGIDLTPINAGLPKVVNRDSQLNPTNNLLSKFDFDPSIATLAAGLFAKPEYESQVHNPYAGAVNRALARRRINVEPTLAANRRSRAINNRNLANISPNTGANLAARTQSAVSEYAQNADLYANRDNANNQYLADAANMMNNLGQQFAQNAVYTNDVNARNRAAARSARNRSIENYNKWYQNKQLMKNQIERDKALYPLLKDYLSYGIKNELLTGLDTRYGK